MTLDELQIGQIASIVEVSGQDGIAIRLMEMGLTDGEEIQLIGFAPLGDPIEFLVRSYRLSLRKAEAKRVTVLARSSFRPPDGHGSESLLLSRIWLKKFPRNISHEQSPSSGIRIRGKVLCLAR